MAPVFAHLSYWHVHCRDRSKGGFMNNESRMSTKNLPITTWNELSIAAAAWLAGIAVGYLVLYIAIELQTNTEILAFLE
jgi:hypothetical protein